ncbi:hypothetical protein MY10362_003709 [Beauveria mimosiformis]
MRIGCLQFAPKVGDIDNNLNRADAVLSRADVEELDLLVLPELAFTGRSYKDEAWREAAPHSVICPNAPYDRLRLCAVIFHTLVMQDELITDTKTRTGYNFKSLKEIAPYLEPSGSGITSLWARTVALKYNCTVIAGYPEKVDVTPKWPTSPEYYNSAIVVSPDGETIANYRKSFLYYTDETWALEGDGFYSGFLPNIGFASLGICNPYKFEAPWHEYEFAFHALDVSANVVIVSMAWMTREEPREFSRMPNEPDLETLTYWITRLEPLVRAGRRDEIIVVFVNRCGIEGDATYAGTSAVLGIHHGEVTVYGLLGRGEKQLLVVDTTHPPYGKLLYRPEYPNKPGVPHGHGKPPTSELDGQDFGVSDKGSESFYGAPDSDSPRQDTDSQSPRQEADGAGTPVAPDRPYNGKCLGISTSQASQVKGTSNPGQSRNASSIVKLESMSASKSIKQPPVAPIKIPEMVPPDLAADIQTPGEDGTTSTPIQVMHSPRTAVRPRLVIPQSPTMIPQQFYPDQPVSAASVMSGKSMHSIRSEDSQASVQTIRSNPRPPEDSTPYPHSGVPLSGYPKRKQIYGGSVAIGQEGLGLGFVPITPLDDMSPISAASWAWPQSANPFGSLNAASAWPSDTPLAVLPEPFPWSSMRDPSRPRSRSTRCLHSNGIAPARRPTPPVTGWSKPRNQPDSHETLNEAVDEWAHVPKNMKRPENEDPDAESARPASPKSRNASRSRLHERPSSAMGKPDFSAAAQHLENVARRVSSVSRPREKQESSEAESFFDAASSREDSPSKEADIQTAFELGDTVIPIVASPSLLTVDSQRHAMVPTPVALDYYRSASNPAQNHATPSLSSRGARTQSRKLSRTQDDAYDRAPSRGRQPRPKTTMTTAEHDRARRVRSTSMDSTRNDLLHRHVRRLSANGGGSLGRNQSRNTINGNIPLPDGYTAEDFERVEEIACPNCPVHGHRSSSANNSVGNAAGRRVSSQNRRRRRRSTSQSLGGLGVFDSPAPERFKLPLRPAPGSDRQSEPRRIPEPRFAPAPVQRPAKKSLHKVKRSFTASPVPRPSTAPLPFDPPTPKAMSFIPDVGDLDSLDEDGLVLTTTIKGKFVETQKEMGMQLSALA